VDARPFDALPGVEGLKADGPRLSFTLHSEPDALVKLAAQHRLVGMEYERPSLEEIFLTYYGQNWGER
jgi:ABC-2 type transport system ATP-binding protein